MNWMTVKELAAYLKLSEAVIYKFAQSGQLPAAKIGDVWRFSQEQIDQYLLKQNNKSAQWPPEPIKDVVHEFYQAVKAEFQDNLSDVLVFGSWARGDADEESDVDLLVILKKIPDYWKEKNKITDIAYNIGYNAKKVLMLSTVLMDEKTFLSDEPSPFLMNVRKDGKRVE